MLYNPELISDHEAEMQLERFGLVSATRYIRAVMAKFTDRRIYVEADERAHESMDWASQELAFHAEAYTQLKPVDDIPVKLRWVPMAARWLKKADKQLVKPTGLQTDLLDEDPRPVIKRRQENLYDTVIENRMYEQAYINCDLPYPHMVALGRVVLNHPHAPEPDRDSLITFAGITI